MVKILSLNCSLFPWIVEIFSCGEVMPKSSERASSITTMILNNPEYSVICLQEVWSYNSYKLIRDKLKYIYPNCTEFKRSCIKLGSGLMTLSKNIMTEEYSENYIDFRGSEVFAHKGYLSVHVKNIGTIINTHLQAGNSWTDKYFCKDTISTQEITQREVKQILEYVAGFDDDERVLIIGDFNVEYDPLTYGSEYSNLIPILNNAKFYNSTMNPVYNTTKQNSIGVIDYSFGRNISLSTTTTKIFDNSTFTYSRPTTFFLLTICFKSSVFTIRISFT